MATGYVLPPETLLRDIRQLAPGETVEVRRGAVTSASLDRMSPAPSERTRLASTEEFEEVLVAGLRRAIAKGGRRGYLLSGGIDSGVLATLAGGLEPAPLRAYSASFLSTGLDESSYARMVAQRVGCSHDVTNLTGMDQLEALPQIIWHLGMPTLDFSVVPTYHLLQHVSASCDVVFSGDGPDHLFCHYAPLAAKRAVATAIRWLPRLPARL